MEAEDVKTDAVKGFEGAPFRTQTVRFDVSGVYPQRKMPGTYTEVPYCKKSTSKETVLRGPGSYDIETGDFTDRAIVMKLKGPNWERAFSVAKISSIPHLLYRNEWEHKKMLAESMSPAKYHIKDPQQQEASSKPSSSRGVCQTTGPRFQQENKFLASVPGPGAYGVPWRALESKAQQSPGMTGMLQSGGTNCRQQALTGGDLAPGHYEHQMGIEELLNKRVSKRGPYDLFSGERYKPPKLLLQNKHLGPGKYQFKPFTQELNDEHHRKQGHFSTIPKYPDTPTERVYLNSLSQWPREKEDPGPGRYTGSIHRRAYSAPSSSHSTKHPFSNSAARFDKRALRLMYGTRNPTDSAQYDTERWHKGQHRHSSASVFVSRTPRMPPKVNSSRELLLYERIHPKSAHRQHCRARTVATS